MRKLRIFVANPDMNLQKKTKPNIGLIDNLLMPHVKSSVACPNYKLNTKSKAKQSSYIQPDIAYIPLQKEFVFKYEFRRRNVKLSELKSKTISYLSFYLKGNVNRLKAFLYLFSIRFLALNLLA